jgi:ribosomal protein S18 acetylase RimI-like enzyme
MALDVTRLAAVLGEEQNAIFAIEGGSSPNVAAGGPAQDGTELPFVAAAGVFRMKQPKFAHRAKVWGVFVDPDHRDQGLGRAVVSAAVDAARGWSGVDHIDLGVSENAPEALHLYESLGFKIWGREPASTSYEGRRYDEIHMTLKV